MTTRPRQRAGGWVCVCGPSGAGKDTLLRWAAERLCDHAGLVFARRVITRPVHDSSPHAQCTDSEYDAVLAAGGFALHWSAHGVRYGIPRTYLAAVAGGAWVVVNGSRAHVAQWREREPQARVRVVLVTAAPLTLVRRLAQRGREDERDVQARVGRNANLASSELAPDLTLDNDGPPERAGQLLVDYLVSVTTPAQATSRNSGSQ